MLYMTTKIIKFLNCTLCGVKTNKKSGLKKHENRHTRKTKYPCDECEKFFLDNFMCEVCSLVFETKEYLRKHVKNVHRTARFMCSFCDKKWTFKA